MTPDRISEIKDRLAKATPGPWWINEGDPSKGGPLIVSEDDNGKPSENLPVVGVDVDAWGGSWEVTRGDAALIANAPADLQFLLAQVEEMGARLEATKFAKPDDQQIAGADDLLATSRNHLPDGEPQPVSATAQLDNGSGVTSTGGESGLPYRFRFTSLSRRIIALHHDGEIEVAEDAAHGELVAAVRHLVGFFDPSLRKAQLSDSPSLGSSPATDGTNG